jgi:hypothetical protein
MQTAIGREFRACCFGAASRLAKHDSAVLLGVFLCFAPLPPVNLFGFVITTMNLLLVSRSKLPKSEIPILRLALIVVLAYATLWTVLLSWMIHSADFSFIAAWLQNLGSWARGALYPPDQSSSSAIQRI